ncbi:TPA: hypothetical protein DCX15_05540 [bacterium]|nr:hypothetical protein [bacterium]
MISDPDRPFYKSGKIMPLTKLPQQEFENFIYSRFRSGKVAVSREDLKFIFGITKNHPYYTQMLCWEVWERCLAKGEISKEDIKETLDILLDHQGEYFLTLWDSFSLQQKMLLLALAEEPTINVFSKDFIGKFGLGVASSIQKSLTRLREPEIIEKVDSTYEISDVFFSIWLKGKMA